MRILPLPCPRNNGPTRRLALALLVGGLLPGLATAGWSRARDDGLDPITRPLPADYRKNRDGSITLRVCYNWSCSNRERVTFSSADLASVTSFLGQCTGDSLHDRIQRIRVGIWRMQLIAQKHLPVLANDREINEFDKDVDGRLDCVDSSSNTNTYLRILHDLGQLPGWNIDDPDVRNLLDLHGVHWTAVVTDQRDGSVWSVDSWFRPHGHLPFVMPLADWKKDRKAWEPPYDKTNPYPVSIGALCSAPAQTAAATPAPAEEITVVAAPRRRR